jgi:peptidyl-prolyl cis-trans isomerase A (cyclophilin A)
MLQRAPPSFTAEFSSTAGKFGIFVNRSWAPHGADRFAPVKNFACFVPLPNTTDRFFNLVRLGFFNNTGLFRMLPGFVIEWGLSGDPALSQVYCNDVTCPHSVPGAAIAQDTYIPGAPLNAQRGTVAYSLMDGGSKGLVNASTEM